MNFIIQGRARRIGQRGREGRIKTAGCWRSGGGFSYVFNCLFPGLQGFACLAPFCARQVHVFAQFMQVFGGVDGQG